MKIYYQTVEKEDNYYISIPVVMEFCCPDSSIWFFKYPLDVSVKEGTLIKKDSNGQPELFLFCQFCGQRHLTQKIQKEKQPLIEQEINPDSEQEGDLKIK